jgi:hypothetical protein
MSGNINRSEIARKARMKGLKNLSKRFKREAKELLKTNPNMSIDEAFALRKSEYYDKRNEKMQATRKANKAAKTTPQTEAPQTEAPQTEAPKLLPFSNNAGKQMVYAGLLSMAKDITTPLSSLTMPGINTEFEDRLIKENEVKNLFLFERDQEVAEVISVNFNRKSFGTLSFPEDFSESNRWKKITAPSLNFVFFDFMGKYLKKYTPAIRQMIQLNEQTELVFGITIGSRGGGETVPIEEVDNTLSFIFKESKWKVKNSLTCSYKSENGTKMTVLMYSLNRSAHHVPNKERREIEGQIANLQAKLVQLQYELFQLEDKSTPTTPTTPKKTRKKYNISPEAATERAKKAWATRRANAAK